MSDREGGIGRVLRNRLRSWFGVNKRKHHDTKDKDWADRRPFIEGLKDMLALHRTERYGFIAFSCILIAMAGWVTYRQWFREPDPIDLGPMRAQVQSFIAARQQFSTRTETQPIASDLQPFDPNDLDQVGWMKVGLSERQASGIMRYMERGGRFRSKADVGKMYSLPAELFAQLEPFILLPDSTVQRDRYDNDRQWSADQRRWRMGDSSASGSGFVHETRTRVVVEVNTADTLQLISVPGIGPSFARGIVKYRDKLGGYVSLDQLNEVFVLKDKPDAVAKLKERLVLDTLMVRRININTCTAEDLTAHPYMYGKWSVARALIAYRTQHGAFTSVTGIKACALVDEELFRKLSPYLVVGE